VIRGGVIGSDQIGFDDSGDFDGDDSSDSRCDDSGGRFVLVDWKSESSLD